MRMPKTSSVMLVLLLMVLTAPAARAESVRDISVNEVYATAEAALPTAGQGGQASGPYTVVAGGPGIQGVQFVVDHTTPDRPVTIPLFGIDNPPMRAGPYQVQGTVSYGGTNGSPDLSGTAYLEMWSTFADGRRFFSRTLADSGPMEKFSGHSIERHFAVSFDPSGNGVPTRLEMNLVFIGTGQVTLENDTDNGSLFAVLQDGPPATAAAPVAPPVMRNSPEQVAIALRLRPELLGDGLRKQTYLLARLALANSESGPASDAAARARQQLQTLQDEIDQNVDAVLMARAMQPRWLTWLDDHFAAWWWGVLFPLVVLSQARTARSRLRGLVTVVTLIVGEICFGWGMAGLGSGQDVSHFAVPLMFGVVIITTTLLGEPLIRWQQNVELRRIAALDAT